MKILNQLLVSLMLVTACTAVVPQQKQNSLSVDTELSTNQFTIDKIDKSLSGDKLVYGTVVQARKQVGIDGIKIITRKTAYNCPRGEFVIKDLTVQDRAGLPITQTSIKTDVIIVPEMDINRQEVAFMCGVEFKPTHRSPTHIPTGNSVSVQTPVTITIEKK